MIIDCMVAQQQRQDQLREASGARRLEPRPNRRFSVRAADLKVRLVRVRIAIRELALAMRGLFDRRLDVR